MGLDWTVALDKQGYFVGRRALEKEKREGLVVENGRLGGGLGGHGKHLQARGRLPHKIPGMAVRGNLPILVGNVQVGYASTSNMSTVVEEGNILHWRIYRSRITKLAQM
ncbi:MAG: hypothetical protein U0V48_04765 [Anaerolineales bacterium]